MNMKLISRDFYLRQLEAVRDIPDIKVITGIRRCGKSSLMDAFSAALQAKLASMWSESISILSGILS